MIRPTLVRISLTFLLFLPSCKAQEKSVDRLPAVAGSFYPASGDELGRQVDALLAGSRAKTTQGKLRALIAPHAGYMYSGGTAARAYAEIDPDAVYDNVFLLSPSHHVSFEGASVYAQGDYITPLGRFPVNRALAGELASKYGVFSTRIDAHKKEHAVEVQLPFLQRRLKKLPLLLPIVIGAGDLRTCGRIAEALRPYFTSRNLFIVSTDFSHYPSYEDACHADRMTAASIRDNSINAVVETVNKLAASGIGNLSTGMCGWSAVSTLLSLSERDPELKWDTLMYRNSGDAAGGDRRRVVGYWAMSLREIPSSGKSGFELSDKEKGALLILARNTLLSRIGGQKTSLQAEDELTPALRAPCGAFVTLKIRGQLRGCIGNFSAETPLFRTVRDMALSAALRDPRFPPLKAGELDEIDIEISVLTPMKRINSIEDFVLGRHGVYIKKNGRSGTFLPQVAKETGWTAEEFLGHCSRDKAGIGWDGWKTAEVYVYEARGFGEPRE